MGGIRLVTNRMERDPNIRNKRQKWCQVNNHSFNNLWGKYSRL